MSLRSAFRSVAFALCCIVACCSASPAVPASGPVILFNDRHSHLDRTALRRDRVIAAVVSHGSVLVAARALFAATGADISFDRATRTFVARRGAGPSISVTAGKRVAVIDGAARPLDVAPEMRGGRLYVPIRVVAEALGYYVSWVPDRRIVVIRYVDDLPTPPPTPKPAPATPAPIELEPPTPAPSPTLAPRPGYPYTRFVAGDALFAPHVGNEFAPNVTGQTQYAVRAAVEYDLDLPIPFLKSGGRNSHSFIEGLYRRSAYVHPADGAFPNGTPCVAPGGTGPSIGNPGCVTTIGQTSSLFQNSARLTEEDLEFRSSLVQIAPHAYLATSTLSHRNQFGYPKIDAPFGVGAEVLPSLRRAVSLYGSAYYFPEANGVYSPPGGPQIRLRYRIFEYDGGATIAVPATPLFLDLSVQGDHFSNKQNAPSDQVHRAIRAGLGLHI